ncbi:PAS domain S-box protein [Roseiflexus castenholzii]|uniref:PAS domain S-box protein n=1 Tax=Roseiflexus castenholzii TaxID=120962 RepID=UPI003C7ED59A
MSTNTPSDSTMKAEREQVYERVAQLERELARFRAIIEDTDLLITEVDANGIFTYVNPAARSVFGYAPEECIGRLSLEFVHPDDLEETQRAFVEWVQRHERGGVIENRVIHRNGSFLHLLWSITLHYDDQGQVQRATSIAHDIGALHQLRSELRESRTMLQLVIDNLPQAIFWKDRELRFLGGNQRLLSDAGLTSVDDIIGKTDFDMPWKDHAAAYQADDRDVIEHGPKLNIEDMLTRNDGSTIWLRTNKVPLRRDGEIVGVLGMYEDVTALKRQEDELRTFKLLVENAPDGIAIADTNLTLTYANPALAAMLGYSSLVGMTVPMITHPDDLEKLSAIVQQVTQGGTPREMIRYLHSNGSIVTVQASALVLYDGHRNLIGYASINRDITEQLQAEESLRASEQRNRALLNAIPDLMFLLSADGVFLDYKTDSSGDLIFPPEAFLNRNVVDVLPPHLAEQVLTHMEALKRTHEMQTYQYQILINDQVRDFEARMVFSNDDILVLSRDTTKQRRAERERQAMQEQIIQAQQAALRELSTPLMPIADGVVAMPIIGTIDTMRAQQIMEALLQGIADHSADIAILDITGVKVVDTQVAGALIRAAQAARMLGARVVLTGISPEIAQTLVHIGAEMREMVAKPTLQQGIAYALEQRVGHHQ